MSTLGLRRAGHAHLRCAPFSAVKILVLMQFLFVQVPGARTHGHRFH